MTFYSRKQDQFTYFAEQVGERDWHGKNVLDFGGNVGNILRDPNSTIDEERYWCIDVGRPSIAAGRKKYPQAHWVFYDRYCFFFNARGVPGLPVPDLGQRFDYIVAYSVFTNMPVSEMRQLVGQLEALLKKGGALAFTFIDPNYVAWPGRYRGNNFHWRLKREKGVRSAESREMLKQAKTAEWCILVNGEDFYAETEAVRPIPPEEQRSFHVFHTEQYMRKLFPRATILPPANDEMQHCCVMRKG